jgi:two-component sensor histidine kinase
MLLVRMLTQQALEDEASLHWLEEQASIRNSLTRELNHRVKNTLANVLSIIALTRRRATNLDEFVEGLDGRIRALSATHDLLTQSDWGTTLIRSVVDAELAPYVQTRDHHVTIAGPDVALAPNDALSLGLAIHELATNAAKYGALTRAGGEVSVEWNLMAPNLVRLQWQERGGPPVKAERGRGFGTDLIEKIVANELDNPVRLEFDEQGVTCTMTIPVRQPTAFAMRASRRPDLPPRERPPAKRCNREILADRAAGAEEQRLTDGRPHGRFLERLGDEIGRLGPVAGQQPLGIGGDEDHRHARHLEDIVDRVEPGRTVGQLDIGQHQARRVLGGDLLRLRTGRGGAGDVVAQRADEILELHRDQRLVLDNEYAGRILSVDLLDRLLHQARDVVFVDFHDLRRLGGREIFDGRQQQSLPVERRDLLQLVLRRRLVQAAAGAFLGNLEIRARP